MTQPRDPETLADHQDRVGQPSASRMTYGILGLCGGFVVGVWAMVEAAQTYRGARVLLVLLAGMIFGTLVGLDLHATRKWGTGKLVFILRTTLACAGAAALTALAGLAVGMVRANEVWQFGAAGAAFGCLISVSWLIESTDLWKRR